MAQVVEIPQFVGTLVAALEARYPGSHVDVKRVKGLDSYGYRLGVLWEPFSDVPVMDRHAAAWAVAEEALSSSQRRQIASIECVTTEELRGPD